MRCLHCPVPGPAHDLAFRSLPGQYSKESGFGLKRLFRTESSLGLDLRLHSISAALGASGHQGAGGGPSAGQGGRGSRQDIVGTLTLHPGCRLCTHTGRDRSQPSPPAHPKISPLGPRRGRSAASARAYGRGCGYSHRARPGRGLKAERQRWAGGRGRAGAGRGRQRSRAAQRAPTWTPGAPTRTPGLCAPPRRGLARASAAGDPQDLNARTGPRRPKETAAQPEEQDVFPGQEKHPPDHGELRSRGPLRASGPLPRAGPGLRAPGKTLPALRRAPLPPCPAPALAPVPARSFPRSPGSPRAPRRNPFMEPAHRPRPSSAPGEGWGEGWGRGGRPAPHAQMHLPPPPPPRPRASGPLWELRFGVGRRRGPLLTPPVRPPASGHRDAIPALRPSALRPRRRRTTRSSLSETKQLNPARSPWRPEPLHGAGVRSPRGGGRGGKKVAR